MGRFFDDIEKWSEFVKMLRDTLALIVLAFVAVATGSWLTEKRKYDHLSLSDYSVPLIFPHLDVPGLDPAPNWVDDLRFCTIRGHYKLVNRGNVPWILDNIKIEVFEYPLVEFSDFPPKESKNVRIIDRSLSNFVASNTPLVSQRVGGSMIVGPLGDSSHKAQGSRQFEINIPLDDFQKEKSEVLDKDRNTKTRNLLIRASGQGGRAELNTKWYDWFRWWNEERPPYVISKEYRFPKNAATVITTTQQCATQLQ